MGKAPTTQWSQSRTCRAGGFATGFRAPRDDTRRTAAPAAGERDAAEERRRTAVANEQVSHLVLKEAAD
jgi:hypothetical protein